jgi:hypothetical protein
MLRNVYVPTLCSIRQCLNVALSGLPIETAPRVPVYFRRHTVVSRPPRSPQLAHVARSKR